MEDEAVLIVPNDDKYYYTYDEIDIETVGIATVATRQEAKEAGYIPYPTKTIPQ